MVRFLRGSLYQILFTCPRPAYCSSANITVPSGNGLDFANSFFKKEFVESTHFSVTTFWPTNSLEKVLFCKLIESKFNLSKLIFFNVKKQSN
jgi:hypothetical protein